MGSCAEITAAAKVIQHAWRVRQGTQYMNIKAIFIFCYCFFSLQLQTFVFFVVLFLGQSAVAEDDDERGVGAALGPRIGAR